MLIQNEFTVAQPAEPLWAYLLDVEKIAPCMPGAELTEAIDDSNWKGKVNVAFGPVKLSFAGTVSIAERDDVAHRVKLAAKGMEAKGKGAATAAVTSWLEPGPDADSTIVKMDADITLTGAAAQLSRGLLPENLEAAHPAFRRLPPGVHVVGAGAGGILRRNPRPGGHGNDPCQARQRDLPRTFGPVGGHQELLQEAVRREEDVRVRATRPRP